MSNTYQEWEDDDDDLDTQDVRQASDSDLLKQLRKELKNKTKALNELETQVTSFRTSQREATIKSVLESKGINPKIANFIPSDLDASPEVINGWIEQNADVFGLAVNSETEQAPNLSALRSIDAITANAQSVSGSEGVLSQIQNASEQELLNMIHAAGGGYGS